MQIAYCPQTYAGGVVEESISMDITKYGLYLISHRVVERCLRVENHVPYHRDRRQTSSSPDIWDPTGK
jgi:hypothetical protein